MKIAIYRDKATKRITNYHEFRESITQAHIDAFNAKAENPTFVEIVELEENSVAYYFYTLKVRKIDEYFEDLRNLEEAISDISYAIDSRLSELERVVKEQDE